MRTPKCFLILFLFISVNIYSQDSLWQQLKLEKDPKVRSDIYSDLAWNLIMDYRDSALIVAQLAEQDAIKNNYLKGQAVAQEYQGLYLEMVKSDYGQAAQIYLDAITFCEKHGLDYDRSLYHSLGILFHTSDNFEKANYYYRKALDLALKAGDDQTAMKCLTNMGSIASSQGKYELARQLIKESLKIPTDNIEVVRVGYGNIGNSYIRQDSFRQALPWLYKAVADVEGEEFFVDAILYSYVLDAKTAVGEFEDIEPWIEKTIASLEVDKNNLRQAAIGHKSIANALNGKGDFKRSNEFYKKYIKLYDQLKQQQKDDLTLELNEKYEAEKKQSALEKKQKQNQFLTAFSLFIILLLGALAYLFFQNKNKSRLLDSRNEALEKSVTEKNLLLKEIHHRVKNNLQVVSSLFSLQSRYITHPEAREVLHKGKDRIKSMALLHENLYQETHFSTVNTKVYFDELINHLFDSYSIGMADIHLEKNIADIDLNIDTMLSLGLITNELISNALKHAWPNGGKGNLGVSLYEKDDRLWLTVEDDGIGINNQQLQRKGALGTKLIQALTKKLKAELTIDSTDGYKVTLTMKNHRSGVTTLQSRNL